MKRRIVPMVVGVVLLVIGGISCGGGGSDDGGGGSGGSVTDAQAQEAATALATTTMVALSAASGGGANANAAPAFNAMMKANQISVTETSSCPAPTLQNPSVDTFVQSTAIFGTDISADGSGTFQLYLYVPAENQMIIEAVFRELNLGSSYNNTSLDGTLQQIVEVTEAANVTSGSSEVLSNEFLIGLIENGATKVCAVDSIDLLQEFMITVSDTSASYTSDLSGCMTVCGSSFTVSGGESGSVQIPSGS